MDLVLDPPRAAGPLRIGMPVEEALRVLRDLPGRIDRPGDPSGGHLVHYESGLSISVWAARDRHVERISD